MPDIYQATQAHPPSQQGHSGLVLRWPACMGSHTVMPVSWISDLSSMHVSGKPHLYSRLSTSMYRLPSVCHLYCVSCSLCRMPLHDWSLSHDTVILSHRYYVNSTDCPSEIVSSSKWHAWFVSRCPGRRLSTWQTTAALCLAALSALRSQLTFRLAWCRKHSAVTATELLQPRDLACGTLFWFSCAIQTLPTDCLDINWRDTFCGNHEHGDLWLLICWLLHSTDRLAAMIDLHINHHCMCLQSNCSSLMSA